MFNSTSKFLYDKFKAKNQIYSLVIHVTKVFNKKIYCKFRGKNQTQLKKKNPQFFGELYFLN